MKLVREPKLEPAKPDIYVHYHFHYACGPDQVVGHPNPFLRGKVYGQAEHDDSQ